MLFAPSNDRLDPEGVSAHLAVIGSLHASLFRPCDLAGS